MVSGEPFLSFTYMKISYWDCCRTMMRTDVGCNDGNLNLTEDYVSIVYTALGAHSVAIAGSGKRTVVRYVARRLGLHVVEYSCNSLMEASENKSSSLLTQAFHTALRYSYG